MFFHFNKQKSWQTFCTSSALCSTYSSCIALGWWIGYCMIGAGTGAESPENPGSCWMKNSCPFGGWTWSAKFSAGWIGAPGACACIGYSFLGFLFNKLKNLFSLLQLWEFRGIDQAFSHQIVGEIHGRIRLGILLRFWAPKAGWIKLSLLKKS